MTVCNPNTSWGAKSKGYFATQSFMAFAVSLNSLRNAYEFLIETYDPSHPQII